MAPERYSVIVEQGVTFRRVVTYGPVSGTNGWVAQLIVRRATRAKEQVVAELNSEDDPTSGAWPTTLPALAAAAFVAGATGTLPMVFLDNSAA